MAKNKSISQSDPVAKQATGAEAVAAARKTGREYRLRQLFQHDLDVRWLISEFNKISNDKIKV